MEATLNDVLTAKALGAILQVNRAKLLRLIAEEGVPHIRLGYELFFLAPSVAAWLMGKEERPGTAGDSGK